MHHHQIDIPDPQLAWMAITIVAIAVFALGGIYFGLRKTEADKRVAVALEEILKLEKYRRAY